MGRARSRGVVGRFGMAFVSVWLALAAGAPRTGADQDDIEAFGQGVAVVRQSLARGEGARGLSQLRELLARHEGRDYARARRAEMEDLARRLAFLCEVEPPDPKTLVECKVLKWNAATGDVKLLFTPETAGDLRRSPGSGLLWMPAPVRGPCKLEVEGPYYPVFTSRSPRMLFGGDEERRSETDVSWQITFGVPPHAEGNEEVWIPAIITRYDGETQTEISNKPVTPARGGKPYKLALTIARESLAATVNGKSIGKADKPKEVYGQLGFEVGGWKEATFTGALEPGWMQGLIDTALQERRQEFEKRFDARQVLPAWLLAAPQEAPQPEPQTDEGLPAKVHPRHLPDLKRIYDALAADDIRSALDGVDRLRAGGAPEAVCAFLAATLYAAIDETTQALEQVRRCTEKAPGFLQGWALQGTLLRRLGRVPDAAEAFLAGIEQRPADASAYELAALGMLWAGDLERAQQFTELAARRGISSAGLARTANVLAKARSGPTFRTVYEVKSANYHVISDIDKRVCVEASQLLEQAFTSYRVNFGWVARDRTQLFKVYLFAGRSGFMQYQEDLQDLTGKPAERAAGLYSGLTKQLLIWNLPDRDEMMRTVRHEGFHQYLDRIMPDPPTWLNEGLAVYHEYAEVEGGRLVCGDRIREYVDLLGEGELVPLRTFLFESHRRFYERGHRSYAQAWAFVHMLQHGDASQKALFSELVKLLQTDTPPREVVRRLFPDDRLETLDGALERYLRALARR